MSVAQPDTRGGSSTTSTRARDASLSAIVPAVPARAMHRRRDRKSTRLNSSHSQISYAVFCLKKKKMQSTNRGKRSGVVGSASQSDGTVVDRHDIIAVYIHVTVGPLGHSHSHVVHARRTAQVV